MRPAVIDFDTLPILGQGGEATVHQLDATRVVRRFKPGATWASVQERTRFLAQVAAGSQHLPFETPLVLEERQTAEDVYTIEKRIAGQSMQDALQTVAGDERKRLIEHYLETAVLIGEIAVTFDQFGEIGLDDGLTAANWHEWLVARARRSLRGTPLADFDVESVVAQLPVCERGRFVHLDYFPGNAMAVGDRVTAVIDFGYACIMGDGRLAAIWAAAYLTLGRTEDIAQPDMDVAQAWLDERGLMQWYDPAVQWLALYWMMVPPSDDPACRAWCVSVLGAIN